MGEFVEAPLLSQIYDIIKHPLKSDIGLDSTNQCKYLLPRLLASIKCSSDTSRRVLFNPANFPTIAGFT